MKEIQLSQNGKKYKGKYVALVDDEDFERVNKLTWCVLDQGKNIYAKTTIGISGRKVSIRMHWFIMGRKWIDHIKHNGLDNQKHNLRPCTNHQNIMNSRKSDNRSSKYKGVAWHKRANKWQANIMISGKTFYMGLFINEVDAAASYDKAAREHFGEFAYLNFKI